VSGQGDVNGELVFESVDGTSDTDRVGEVVSSPLLPSVFESGLRGARAGSGSKRERSGNMKVRVLDT